MWPRVARHVLQRVFLRVRDAIFLHARVVREPAAAARDEGGAANIGALLEHDDIIAECLRGDRRGERRAAAADDDDVMLGVPAALRRSLGGRERHGANATGCRRSSANTAGLEESTPGYAKARFSRP
jgi:hypothetical protein